MDTLISIIGGANMDMSATLNGAFIAADSNPGHIEVGYGGVARNIAHNLALLGARTQLLTVFGGDLFGGLMHDYCKQQGIDVHLSERESSQRSGIYLCLHNQGGEMIAAVADTEAIRLITPEWLAKRIGEINMSEFIVADTNVTEDSIRWLMENVTAPLFIDGVSSTKAHRVVNALRKCKLPYLHTLKYAQAQSQRSFSSHRDCHLQRSGSTTARPRCGTCVYHAWSGGCILPQRSGRMALPYSAGRDSQHYRCRRRVPRRSRLRSCQGNQFPANGAIRPDGGSYLTHEPQSREPRYCEHITIKKDHE